MKNLLFLILLFSTAAFGASKSVQGDLWLNNALTLQWTPPGVSDTLVGVSATQTLASKTLASPVISGTMSGGVYTGTVSGTGIFLDNLLTLQDDGTPTKKGQFNTSGVTAGQTRVLDFPDDNGVLACVSCTQTLTNKTLTNPTINSATLSGTMSGGVYTGTASGTVNVLDNLLTLQDNTTPTKKGQFNTSNVTGGTTRILDFPDYSGLIATTSGTETFTNKTLTSPTINGATFSGTLTGGVYTGTVSGTGIFNDNVFTLQDDATPTKKGQFNLSSVTAGQTRTYDLPDISSTIAVLAQAQTFSVSQTFSQGIILGNGQINFPAAQVASTNANTLDDYEEGTFTPTISGGSTAGAGTYTTQAGFYTKVGNLVCFTHRAVWTAHTGTGNFLFTALPFTSKTTANAIYVFSVYTDAVALTASNYASTYLPNNSTSVNLYNQPVGGGAATTVTIDTAATTTLSGCYFTD